MSLSSPGRFRTLLRFEQLESRVNPDSPGPGGQIYTVSVPDWDGLYQIYGPTTIEVFAGTVLTTPSATLDYSTATIVTPPVRGVATIDPSTGVVQYTPNYLIPNGLLQGQSPGEVLPESFSYQIRDNFGGVSNVATATFHGGVAPVGGGKLRLHGGGAVTRTLEPVSITLSDWVETLDDVQADYHSFTVTGQPTHGTLGYNPATTVITYTPDFGYTGFDTFTFSLRDTTDEWGSDGGSFVLINPTATPRLQADPLGGQTLVIDGTPNDDTVVVTPGRRGEVTVSVNGVTSGPFRPTGRVAVLGYGGNDRIQVAGTLGVPTWLAGGNGTDTLIAGGGPAVMLGGAGNDLLAAGRGRDVMVGGTGTDTLTGTGNDLLVPGSTAFDADMSALDAIAREWGSAHTYSQRVLNLSGQFTRQSARRLNGDVYLTPATVLDDRQADTLVPGGWESLMFPATSAAPPNVADVVVEPTPPPPPPRPLPLPNRWGRLSWWVLPPRGHCGGALLGRLPLDLDGYDDRIHGRRG